MSPLARPGVRFALFALLWGATFGCKGPSNPEPILATIEVRTELMTMTEEALDMLNISGYPGAVVEADHLQVVNLDRAIPFDAPVEPDGSFHIVLPGLEIERFRVTSLDTASGGFLSVVVTGNAADESVDQIPEAEQGCLRIDPPHLDLGETESGQPLYGEVTLISDCPAPVQVLTVQVDNPRFTPVTLLTDGPLPPGGQGIISITFLSPGGLERGILTVETDLAAPEQLPLVVTLGGDAAPPP